MHGDDVTVVVPVRLWVGVEGNEEARGHPFRRGSAGLPGEVPLAGHQGGFGVAKVLTRWWTLSLSNIPPGFLDDTPCPHPPLWDDDRASSKDLITQPVLAIYAVFVRGAIQAGRTVPLTEIASVFEPVPYSQFPKRFRRGVLTEPVRWQW